MFNKEAKLNPSNNNAYYTLIGKEKSALSVLGHALKSPFVFSYKFTRYLAGRALSYFLLNPLFRKQEREQTTIESHPQSTDEKMKNIPDLYIFNIGKDKKGVSTLIENWRHQSIVYLDKNWNPVNSPKTPAPLKDGNKRIDDIINKIVHLVTQKEVKLSQIHFKGLHHLSDVDFNNLLDRVQSKFNGHDLKKNFNQLHFYTLKTKEGAELDSVEIRPEDVNPEPHEDQKYIIWCLPRSNNYDRGFKQLQCFANECRANVITFNYRGTGMSKGIVASHNDMVEDVIAQVERLKAQGVNPEKIVLAGECLGGNTATVAAKELHDADCKVKLFNIRSFRSVPEIIRGRLLPDEKASTKNPMTWLKRGFAHLIAFIMKPLLKLAGWEMSAEQAFKSIPPTHLDYLTVRPSSKDEAFKGHVGDKMVPHKNASIYSVAKAINKSEPKQPYGQHKSHRFFVDPTQREQAAKTDGHTCSLSALKQRASEGEEAVDGRTYTINGFNQLLSGPEH